MALLSLFHAMKLGENRLREVLTLLERFLKETGRASLGSSVAGD